MKLSCIVILIIMSAYLGMYEIQIESYAQEKKLTIEDIKKNYTDRPIKDIIPFKENFVLVEWQKPTFANRFDLYNLKTGEMNHVYGTTNYVKLHKIVDEDRIILFADGRESEARYWEFPLRRKILPTISRSFSYRKPVPSRDVFCDVHVTKIA